MSPLINAQTPAQQAAQQVLSIVNQQYAQLYSSEIQAYNLIWKNARATPQEVLTALGTAAEMVFELAELDQSTLNAAAAIASTTAPVLPSVPSNYTLTFDSAGNAIAVQSSSSSSS